MAPIQVGDTIPAGIFPYVPYSADNIDAAACGLPSKVDTASWAGKKIVLFGVPGAFTPTCSNNHLPPYISEYEAIKSKGVDAIYCLSSNDLFVMSSWGKVFQAGDKVTMVSDASLKWLGEAGLTQDLSHVGFGTRSSRFAMIIDDLKVSYIGIEAGPGVSVSGAEAVLAKL